MYRAAQFELSAGAGSTIRSVCHSTNRARTSSRRRRSGAWYDYDSQGL